MFTITIIINIICKLFASLAIATTPNSYILCLSQIRVDADIQWYRIVLHAADVENIDVVTAQETCDLLSILLSSFQEASRRLKKNASWQKTKVQNLRTEPRDTSINMGGNIVDGTTDLT